MGQPLSAAVVVARSWRRRAKRRVAKSAVWERTVSVHGLRVFPATAGRGAGSRTPVREHAVSVGERRATGDSESLVVGLWAIGRCQELTELHSAGPDDGCSGVDLQSSWMLPQNVKNHLTLLN